MTKFHLILSDPQLAERGRRGKMRSLRQKKRKQSFCESDLKMPLLPLTKRQPAESRGAAFGPGAGWKRLSDALWRKCERPPRERTDT